jgi:hypothetical protein
MRLPGHTGSGAAPARPRRARRAPLVTAGHPVAPRPRRPRDVGGVFFRGGG